MTRKDYELIAYILRNSDLPGNIRSQLALNFCAALKRDNPSFKPTRFCQAARPDIADSEAIKANNAKGFVLEHAAWDPILDLSLRANA
jgi:hypothetical protein